MPGMGAHCTRLFLVLDLRPVVFCRADTNQRTQQRAYNCGHLGNGVPITPTEQGIKSHVCGCASGYANKNGISTTIGEGAYFWTEKADGDKRGTARSMFSTDKEVSSISVDKGFYLAVRCVKIAE